MKLILNHHLVYPIYPLMESVKHLLFVYAAVSSVNIIINGILWFLTRSKLTFFMFLQWVVVVGVWMIQVKTVSGSDFVRISGFALPVFFAHLAVAHSLAALVGFRIKHLQLFIIMGSAYLLTVGLHLLGYGSVIMGLPAMIGCAVPAVEASLRALFGSEGKTSFVIKGLAISICLFGFYNFSFITSFIAPEMMIYGFGLAIVLVFLISTLGPAAAIEHIAREKAEVEAEAKYRDSLIHSAKMTALGEMAGGVAHEINNPLAILVIANEQILENLSENPGKNIDKLKDLANTSLKTLNRIKKIIVGLRSFSRDGSQDLIEKVGIQETIETTLSFCNERFKTNGIEITVVNSDKSLMYEGRKVEVSQVLLNLLNNAFDYVSKLETNRWVRIEVAKSNDHVEVRVSNSGSKIHKEHESKIFQPFFTTKELGKGAGLGLSISLGLITAQNGSLFLDSKAKNTTFVMTLPVEQSEELKRSA